MIAPQWNAGNRVLAFGAHPDDLEVGAGGLLARLARQGAEVVGTVVSVPTLVAERTAEAALGAKVIGMRLVILNPGEQCRVENLPMHELVAKMDMLVADVRPDLVITHSAHDLHWDHGLVHRATLSALRRWRCNLLAYVSSYEMNAQVGMRTLGHCFADVSSTIDVKVAAIAAHKSQLQKIDLQSTRELARAMGRLGGVEHAECYEALRITF
jgi:LmbE family N-acetylglucosaminyl deacetylase